MPNPNAIVSRVSRIDGEHVVLEGDRRARLDPGNARLRGLAPILERLREQRMLAYVEIDPATAAITRLLIPHVTRVVDVRPSEDGLDVDLEMSHARHVVRRGGPDFSELERQLRESMRSGRVIVVTEDDAHNIIDVRAYTPGPGDPGPPLPPPPSPVPTIPKSGWLQGLWRWPWWPWWWFRCGCVSAVRAQQLFNAMAATTCNPLTVPPPCIPFMYPDDGCWGRAHEMGRLIVSMGVTPRKVWIKAAAATYLKANTRNNPMCYVQWNWHVAPTICVRYWRFVCLVAREMVIDPSLFTTPVTKATWKGVQNNPGATLTDADWTIFYLWTNEVDPTFAKTNQVLATYRLQLQLRSQSPAGPPPYANCP